jgi:hypothetical protein
MQQRLPTMDELVARPALWARVSAQQAARIQMRAAYLAEVAALPRGQRIRHEPGPPHLVLVRATGRQHRAQR